MMFEYDVFLSYSSEDKSIVHALAERLKQDGLRVWLDAWVIKPGDLISLKIQQGLEQSKKVLMCMSPAYFEAEWGKMEHHTLLFRDPTNIERRLIPIMIANCTIPDTIAQFAFIDWITCSDESYNKILVSCQEKQREEVKIKDPKTFTSHFTGIEFVLIPAGKFVMGSPYDEQGRYEYEGPLHEITIKNDFYISKYPITQKQWEKAVGDKYSKFKGENHPVDSVSWDNVEFFIKRLNIKENTDKYRLPSESEWEYACRAGTQTSYSFGNKEFELYEYAWYAENSGGQTHPVGLKKPNPWGLYDMYGNVWEWVQDNWHKNYINSPSDGDAWEDNNIFSRVSRGGCWNNDASRCRSAYRCENDPGTRSPSLGFRLVREI